MMDLTKLMDIVRTYCQQFHQLDDLPDVKISWGFDIDPEKTEDPFRLVQLKSNRIIVNNPKSRSKDWIIDVLRGLLVFYTEPSLQDSWPSWNFFTMTALLIVPSTVLADNFKTKYKKRWIEVNQAIDKPDFKYNYLRWYQILASYPRVFVTSLLQNFLRFYNKDRGNLEYQFSVYLMLQDFSFESAEELALVSYCLRHQTIDNQEISQQFPEISQSTMYRLLQHLSLQLIDGYLPNYANLDLHKVGLILPSHNRDQLRALKQSPGYIHLDTFRDRDDIIIELIVDSKAAEELMNAVSGLDIQIIEYAETFKSIHYRLDLYNFATEQWESTGSSTEIIDQWSMQPMLSQLTHDHLFVLQDILQSRTENPVKLARKLSISKTKKLIKSLKQQYCFFEKILWRPPASFVQFMWIRLLDQNIDENNFAEYKRVISKELHEFSFQLPYVVVKPAYLKGNMDKDKVPVLVYIASGPEKTIQKLSKMVNGSKFAGTLKYPTGEMLKIPVDRFDTSWNFDVDYIVNNLVEVHEYANQGE